MSFVFSDASVQRVVVEPDTRNKAVQALNAAVGFRPLEVVALSYKYALLSTCTRSQHLAASRSGGPLPENAG